MEKWIVIMSIVGCFVGFLCGKFHEKAKAIMRRRKESKRKRKISDFDVPPTSERWKR